MRKPYLECEIGPSIHQKSYQDMFRDRKLQFTFQDLMCTIAQ